MKPEFEVEKVVAAFNELGYTGLEAQTAMLADPAKCRLVVAKVQGDEAAKRSDPVYLERYRKRAERMVKAFNGRTTSETTETETASAMPAAVEANKAETPAQPTPPKKTKGKKVMATKVAKVAKSKKPAKAKKATRTPNPEKGPGVIDTIVAVLQKGGGSVTTIAEKVAKALGRPATHVEKIAATVRIQMTRLEKSKDEGGRKLKIKRAAQEGTREKLYSI